MLQSVLQSVLRGFGGDTVSASVSATVSAAVWLVTIWLLRGAGISGPAAPFQTSGVGGSHSLVGYRQSFSECYSQFFTQCYAQC